MKNLRDYLRAEITGARPYPGQEDVLGILGGVPADQCKRVELLGDPPPAGKPGVVLRGSEIDYREFLRERGMWNGVQSGKRMLIAGRRAGKTSMQLMMLRHEVEKLYQKEYRESLNIEPGTRLSVIVLTCTTSSVEDMHQRFKGLIEGSWSEHEGRYKSLTGRKRVVEFYLDGEANPFLDVEFMGYSKNVEKVSEKTCYMLVADECLWDMGRLGKFIGACLPSMRDTGGERMVLMSTLPEKKNAKRESVLRTLYESEINNGNSDWCVIGSLPSWWLNPKIPQYFLLNRLENDAVSFGYEYRGSLSPLEPR